MTDMTSGDAGPVRGPDPIAETVLADAGAAVAAFLRLGDGAATALVRRLAAVAIGVAEAFLGQALIGRVFEDMVVADGSWHRLAAEPVRGIADVTQTPPGAPPLALPVTAYQVDIGADGRGWVRLTGAGGGPPVAVRYTAGLAVDWAGLPAPIAQGVVALAASLFGQEAGATLPPGVAALWRPFRRLHLSEGRR